MHKWYACVVFLFDRQVQAKILKVMKSNIPGQSGFVVGFITGLKKGGGR